MKSAKEFVVWLHERFKNVPEGVYLTRDHITTYLTDNILTKSL